MGDDDVGGGVEDPFFIKVLCIFGPSLNLNRRLFIIVSLLSTVYFKYSFNQVSSGAATRRLAGAITCNDFLSQELYNKQSKFIEGLNLFELVL